MCTDNNSTCASVFHATGVSVRGPLGSTGGCSFCSLVNYRIGRCCSLHPAVFTVHVGILVSPGATGSTDAEGNHQ